MHSGLIVGLTLNYRDATRTECCVRSLLDDGVDHALVWDNSDDQERSKNELEQLFASCPQVTINGGPENLGFARAVNEGIDWCKSRYPGAWILLINNDARIVTGALEKLQFLLGKHPEAWFSYPVIDHGVSGTRAHLYYHRLTGLLTRAPLPGSFAHASGCCLLIAPERIENSLFDEDFFMYGEDAELGWRLHGTQAAGVNHPETLVVHEGSASSGMATAFYEEHMVAAHLLLARKLSGSRLERLLFFALRWPFLVLRAIVRSLRYRSIMPLRALARGRRIARRSSDKSFSHAKFRTD